jgi:hypothetical protein
MIDLKCSCILRVSPCICILKLTMTKCVQACWYAAMIVCAGGKWPA